MLMLILLILSLDLHLHHLLFLPPQVTLPQLTLPTSCYVLVVIVIILLQYASQTESSPQSETIFLAITQKTNVIDFLIEVYAIYYS